MPSIQDLICRQGTTVSVFPSYYIHLLPFIYYDLCLIFTYHHLYFVYFPNNCLLFFAVETIRLYILKINSQQLDAFANPVRRLGIHSSGQIRTRFTRGILQFQSVLH